LTVIRGEIEAVVDGVHPPESLGNVVDEVELMERLLEDLRTLALAEAGGLELVLEQIDLGELVGDVVASFTSVMRSQDVTGHLEVDAAAEARVDPHRMHQVVGNLISNALAQMPGGGRLEVAVRGTTIVVADTGPGLPVDTDSVFDRFVKASDSTGSGLGLSIARDLVQAHGGTITAGNRPDGGAVFEVHLRTTAQPMA
jgi:signal transduction histidine kinase